MNIDRKQVEADRKAGRNTAEDDVCPICHGFGDYEDGRICEECQDEGTRIAYDKIGEAK